jgi:hypothetical protein
MKTIEQAAKDYSAECYLYNDAMRMQAETHFEAGVEFAQRWIPVEEELPEEGALVQAKYEKRLTDTQVKIGYTYATCRTNEFTSELWLVDTGYNAGRITHWRPIELK